MSLDSLNNLPIKNNKLSGANTQQMSGMNSAGSASIFMSANAGKMNSSASIFGGGASNFSNVNNLSSASFSKPQQAEVKENQGGLMSQIKGFFKPQSQQQASSTQDFEQNLSDVLARANAVLAQAQKVTSSQEAKELIKKSEQPKTEQAEESKPEEKNDDDKKIKDYSQATKEQLERAITAGKPQDEMTAKQMLNNPHISAEQLEKIQKRFPNSPEINEAVSGLKDKFS